MRSASRKTPTNQSVLKAGVHRCLLACAFILTALSQPMAAEEGALWNAIRTGAAFAIMRHELAPGTGDPDNFQIGDCNTQRNLNDTGRSRAVATGKRFRDNGIERAEIYTSQWCRCRETAELLGLGDVEDLPALNSFFQDYEQRAPQTDRLKAWLENRDAKSPLVLVTHQVNIRALTGESTSSGQIIVAQRRSDGAIEVLGKL